MPGGYNAVGYAAAYEKARGKATDLSSVTLYDLKMLEAAR